MYIYEAQLVKLEEDTFVIFGSGEEIDFLCKIIGWKEISGNNAIIENFDRLIFQTAQDPAKSSVTINRKTDRISIKQIFPQICNAEIESKMKAAEQPLPPRL